MWNFWFQEKTPTVCWSADVSALLERPDDLVQLMERILDAGDRHAVHSLSASASAVIRQRWAGEGIVQCHPGYATHRPVARLAWYDEEDRLVEGDVHDLGTLLRGLEPTKEAIPSSCKQAGYAPLMISGATVRYEGDPLRPMRLVGDVHTIAFLTHSDVWFPFVYGRAHPLVVSKALSEQRMFDNRELAMRHTPRLNRFLADVRSAVQLTGGDWSVELQETDPMLLPWVSEIGIRLDSPVPELMPDDAYYAPWESLEEE